MKPRKTLADYLVIGVSPVLIMLLVGSLVFFLIQVFYRGEMVTGIRWVLFWFVLAIVLVSRIGIEQGPGHALVYGAALAVATWLYLVRTHPAYLLGLVLLAVVWWCAHKLTWDCTLIDDEDDASGFGLLQAADATAQKPAPTPGVISSDPAGGRGSTRAHERKAGLKTRPTASRPSGTGSARNRRRRARPFQPDDARDRSAPAPPPGLWVVYFSLAALPSFGLGQVLLPGGDANARRIGFGLLVIYLVAALGLLLTTSFLGLRRYLRQRFLKMPARVAFGWVRSGAAVAVVVLILALLPPRPGADYTWKTLAYRIDYRIRRASEYAMRVNPHGEGPGRAGRQASQADGQNGPGSEPGAQAAGSRSGATQPGRSSQSRQIRTVQPTASLESPGGGYQLLRNLLLLIAAALVIGWLIRHRQLVLEMIRSVIAAVRQFFQDLLHPPSGIAASRAGAVESPRPKPRPFAAYVNPFVTGKNRVWPPERLIAYSFEAAEAWAREQGVEARPQQTPREFCLALSARFPEVASGWDRLAYGYAHAAYGRRCPDSWDPAPIQELWRYLSAQAAASRPSRHG
ncbi:MAG: DUF4129 domain-containing protein [Verrucomicrobia bacterium]|nr:DUF4129 domain-containing protein [Verrucomicrobiota bacterium]